MDRRALLIGLAGLITTPALAISLDDIFNSATSGKGSAPGTGRGLPPGVSSSEGVAGLKEALTDGAVAAVLRVGKLDGYWADDKIRIPLPGALNTIQNTLRPIGASGPLDDLQLRINHAAETAAPQARDLFVDAIRSMTVSDVASILRGGNTAGTAYLRDKTGDGLATLFRPPIRSALDSTGAVSAFNTAVAQHGAGGLAGDHAETTLTDFAVTKGLDGIFHYVGVEEQAIRSNPLKQSSSLLKKVFGGL